MHRTIRVMRWVAVAISISFAAFAGCDRQEERAAVDAPVMRPTSPVMRPGEQVIEFKVLRSDDPQEEADRELVRQWIADEFGVKMSEVAWKHHKYEPLSFEGSPRYVEILKNQNKTDDEIRQKIEEANETRYVEFKPAGRQSMAFSIRNNEVRKMQSTVADRL